MTALGRGVHPGHARRASRPTHRRRVLHVLKDVRILRGLQRERVLFHAIGGVPPGGPAAPEDSTLARLSGFQRPSVHLRPVNQSRLVQHLHGIPIAHSGASSILAGLATLSAKSDRRVSAYGISPPVTGVAPGPCSSRRWESGRSRPRERKKCRFAHQGRPSGMHISPFPGPGRLEFGLRVDAEMLVMPGKHGPVVQVRPEPVALGQTALFPIGRPIRAAALAPEDRGISFAATSCRAPGRRAVPSRRLIPPLRFRMWPGSLWPAYSS